MTNCAPWYDVLSSQVPGDIELPDEPATVVFDEFNHQSILRDWERKFNDSKEDN